MSTAITQEELCGRNSFLGGKFSDRRVQRIERRVNKRKAAIHALYRRRRQSTRRSTDAIHGVYVDTHERSLWYLATGLMLLCVFDAFFTTVLIHHGSEELNPILDYLLQIDLSLFLAVKFIMTGLCISFLVLHKHHRLLNTVSCYHLLVGSVIIYTVLICYQLFMIRLLPGLI